MGSILRATCSCGYVSDAIFAGGGMEPGFESMAGRCDHCHQVVTVRVSGRRLRCAKCGRKPSLYELFDPHSLDESLGDRLHQCPRCLREALSFEMDGIWD